MNTNGTFACMPLHVYNTAFPLLSHSPSAIRSGVICRNSEDGQAAGGRPGGEAGGSPTKEIGVLCTIDILYSYVAALTTTWVLMTWGSFLITYPARRAVMRAIVILEMSHPGRKVTQFRHVLHRAG